MVDTALALGKPLREGLGGHLFLGAQGKPRWESLENVAPGHMVRLVLGNLGLVTSGYVRLGNARLVSHMLDVD